MRPFNLGCYEVRNIVRPIRGGSAELMFSEVVRVREPSERKVKDSGNLDSG